MRVVAVRRDCLRHRHRRIPLTHTRVCAYDITRKSSIHSESEKNSHEGPAVPARTR